MPITSRSVVLPHCFVGLVIASRGVMNAASQQCVWAIHNVTFVPACGGRTT